MDNCDCIIGDNECLVPSQRSEKFVHIKEGKVQRLGSKIKFHCICRYLHNSCISDENHSEEAG